MTAVTVNVEMHLVCKLEFLRTSREAQRVRDEINDSQWCFTKLDTYKAALYKNTVLYATIY